MMEVSMRFSQFQSHQNEPLHPGPELQHNDQQLWSKV